MTATTVRGSRSGPCSHCSDGLFQDTFTQTCQQAAMEEQCSQLCGSDGATCGFSVEQAQCSISNTDCHLSPSDKQGGQLCDAVQDHCIAQAGGVRDAWEGEAEVQGAFARGTDCSRQCATCCNDTSKNCPVSLTLGLGNTAEKVIDRQEMLTENSKEARTSVGQASSAVAKPSSINRLQALTTFSGPGDSTTSSSAATSATGSDANGASLDLSLSLAPPGASSEQAREAANDALEKAIEVGQYGGIYSVLIENSQAADLEVVEKTCAWLMSRKRALKALTPGEAGRIMKAMTGRSNSSVCREYLELLGQKADAGVVKVDAQRRPKLATKVGGRKDERNAGGSASARKVQEAILNMRKEEERREKAATALLQNALESKDISKMVETLRQHRQSANKKVVRDVQAEVERRLFGVDEDSTALGKPKGSSQPPSSSSSHYPVPPHVHMHGRHEDDEERSCSCCGSYEDDEDQLTEDEDEDEDEGGSVEGAPVVASGAGVGPGAHPLVGRRGLKPWDAMGAELILGEMEVKRANQALKDAQASGDIQRMRAELERPENRAAVPTVRHCVQRALKKKEQKQMKAREGAAAQVVAAGSSTKLSAATSSSSSSSSSPSLPPTTTAPAASNKKGGGGGGGAPESQPDVATAPSRPPRGQTSKTGPNPTSAPPSSRTSDSSHSSKKSASEGTDNDNSRAEASKAPPGNGKSTTPLAKAPTSNAMSAKSATAAATSAKAATSHVAASSGDATSPPLAPHIPESDEKTAQDATGGQSRQKGLRQSEQEGLMPTSSWAPGLGAPGVSTSYGYSVPAVAENIWEVLPSDSEEFFSPPQGLLLVEGSAGVANQSTTAGTGSHASAAAASKTFRAALSGSTPSPPPPQFSPDQFYTPDNSFHHHHTVSPPNQPATSALYAVSQSRGTGVALTPSAPRLQNSWGGGPTNSLFPGTASEMPLGGVGLAPPFPPAPSDNGANGGASVSSLNGRRSLSTSSLTRPLSSTSNHPFHQSAHVPAQAIPTHHMPPGLPSRSSTLSSDSLASLAQTLHSTPVPIPNRQPVARARNSGTLRTTTTLNPSSPPFIPSFLNGYATGDLGNGNGRVPLQPSNGAISVTQPHGFGQPSGDPNVCIPKNGGPFGQGQYMFGEGGGGFGQPHQQPLSSELHEAAHVAAPSLPIQSEAATWIPPGANNGHRAGAAATAGGGNSWATVTAHGTMYRTAVNGTSQSSNGNLTGYDPTQSSTLPASHANAIPIPNRAQGTCHSFGFASQTSLGESPSSSLVYVQPWGEASSSSSMTVSSSPIQAPPGQFLNQGPSSSGRGAGGVWGMGRGNGQSLAGVLRHSTAAGGVPSLGGGEAALVTPHMTPQLQRSGSWAPGAGQVAAGRGSSGRPGPAGPVAAPRTPVGPSWSSVAASRAAGASSLATPSATQGNSKQAPCQTGVRPAWNGGAPSPGAAAGPAGYARTPSGGMGDDVSSNGGEQVLRWLGLGSERGSVHKQMVAEYLKQVNGGPAMEGDEDDDEGLCVICLERPSTTVYIPCNHSSFCLDCAKWNFEARKSCPVCRGDVEKYVTVEA